MNIPKIKFSGHSDTGKTSLIGDVMSELKDRGYSVGVLKHDPHDHWEWDEPATDTARHARVGADVVSILSPQRHGIYQSHHESFDVDDLVEKMKPRPDVVLLEGFKSGSYPGFEAMDGEWEDHTGKTFSSKDVVSITDRVEEIGDLDSTGTTGETRCRLTVDGEEVSLKSFPKSALVEVIEGYVRSLSDVEPGKSLTVEIEHFD